MPSSVLRSVVDKGLLDIHISRHLACVQLVCYPNLSTWKAWTSKIMDWMSSSLLYLLDQLTVAAVGNTWEIGDIYLFLNHNMIGTSPQYYQLLHLPNCCAGHI